MEGSEEGEGVVDREGGEQGMVGSGGITSSLSSSPVHLHHLVPRHRM